MGNGGFAWTDDDGNDIEARLQAGEVVGGEIPLGGAHDLSLLVCPNRFGRGAEP